MIQPYLNFAGSPLIPPSYLTLYFGIFFIALAALYIYFFRKRKPVLLFQKIKLLVVLTVILKLVVVIGGGFVAAYWLIPAPTIRRVVQDPTGKIEVVFDRPISRPALTKTIEPDTPGVWIFENSVYTTHLYRNLVFYPSYSLKSDTTYIIKLNGIRNLLNISKPYDYQFDIKTPSSPKIVDVSLINGEFKINLDSPNYGTSQFEFQFSPQIEYNIELSTDKLIYTITPKDPLQVETEYNLKIRRTEVVLNLDDETVIERGNTEDQYDKNFTINETSGIFGTVKKILTTSPAKIASITPENGWAAVSVHTPIKITFDKEPNHESKQQAFLIEPRVEGNFNWDGSTLIFTPNEPLSFATLYNITLGSFKSKFTTQDATVKLTVPSYLQKYTLSCEAASLRMALNFRNLNLSEDDLIPKVGFDNTPHKGNVWGNPYNAFVGNIRGTQMVDGYGVYWAPIAKAARAYRNAQDFQGWSINELTKTVAAGNPVVIWVYSHLGRITSWNTPDGVNIYAVRDEHAVVVVGFVGPQENPTQIIINDPLIGQTYWSRATFDRKWNIFGRSGVVVY